MDKQEIIRKLTSRKFWMAVCGFVALLLVGAGKTEQEAAQITAIIMAGATVLGYILGEGLIDAARAGQEDLYEPVDDLDGEDDTEAL